MPNMSRKIDVVNFQQKRGLLTDSNDNTLQSWSGLIFILASKINTTTAYDW